MVKPHQTASTRTDIGVCRRLRNWLAPRPAHGSHPTPSRLALEPLEQRRMLSVGPFPTPMQHVEPVGSLIYSGSIESTFDSPGGSDAWTIDLEAGQTATLVVESDAGLQPAIALSDLSGTLATATATAAGETVILQTVPINEAATYTITVDAQSETTGTYNARLILGAAVEAEQHNGPTNDTPATAEDLSPSFTDVDTAQRGAVLGSLPIDTIGEDWYEFTLDDGQSSTLVLNSDALNHEAAESVTLELYDSDTNLLALGMPTGNADRAIETFIDQTTDTTEATYYARVSGSGGSYRLVVVKDGHLDLETEDWSGEPTQDATYYSTILGHLTNNKQELTGSDTNGVHFFGGAVSIHGNTAIVFAKGTGAAYVFQFDGVRWTEQQKLTVPYAAGGDVIGKTVSINGDTAIVGAYRDGDEGSSSGSAYIFRFDGSRWQEEQKLTASDAEEDDRFGSAVSIDGDTALVGAYASDDAGDLSGSAYVFRFNGNRWEEEGKLTASDAAEGDNFGEAVSIFGDTALVGAYRKDGAEWFSGSAYIFRFDGNRWEEEEKLTASDAAGSDYFGTAVSIDGNTAIIGASANDDAGNNSGSAYIFRFDGNRWEEKEKLTASDAADGDYFGDAVSIDGDTAVVGAYGNDIPRVQYGASYIFRFDGSRWHEDEALTVRRDNAIFGFDVSTDGDTVVVGGPGRSAYVFGPGLADDPYAVDIKVGDELLITTTTPGDTLDPALELYDPAGTLVADDDNGASDGRNSRLAHAATVSGSYMVKVLAAGDSRGNYVLNISGQTGEGPVFEAVATVPDGSEILASVPSQITVDFNDSVLVTSLDASDLTFNGMAAAAVSLLDHDTVVFNVPPGLVDGVVTVRIAAGAIFDLQGTPIEDGQFEFTLDTTPPVVEVSFLSAFDKRPSLSGLVDDPEAVVTVVVDGQTYAATNHGDGTWSLADDSISPALAPGVYDVQVTAVDQVDHAGTDTTVDELTIYDGGGILGTKWLDANGNGQRDPLEPGLAGVTIYLDRNRNGQLDSGEPSTVTLADDPRTEADESGTYLFTGLDAGSYVVAVIVPDGWAEPTAVLHATDPGPTTIYPNDLIRIDELRADPRFTGLDGSGYAVVVLDSGVDTDHPFFGPDSDDDGVADRIVYQWDYIDDDGDTSDIDGHGTHVTGIVGSEDSTYPGMAPGVDIISLRVLGDKEEGGLDDVETALQWVIDNAVQYNIIGVNMSFGDDENYNTEQTDLNVTDELATLKEMGVIVVAASGNSRFEHEGQPGVAYPAADPNVLAVGAVFNADAGPRQYETPDGEPDAEAFSSAPDRILPITQRTAALPIIFAPGDPITNAGLDGEIVTYIGTSQATAHVSGVAAVAQQLAVEHLGRRLTVEEFGDLLQTTGMTINDGDDEDDNVTHTGADFARMDVFAMAEAILTMADLPGKHVLRLGTDEVIEGVDFGNVSGVPITPLGPVDLITLGHVEASATGHWYRLTAARDGLLTVAAAADALDGVELLLTDEFPVKGQDAVPLAMATLVDDVVRFDYPVVAGEAFFVRVTGTGTTLDLTLANLVRQVDAEVQVFGTDGSDRFEFRAGESFQVTIGGLPYTFDGARVDTITFDGGEGDDTAVLYGTAGDESVTLRPSEAVFIGEAFEVSVAQTGDITVHGEGGYDSAALFDSPGNDNFVGAPTYAAIDGNGFFNRVWNFAEVRADADAGGIDVAKFFDLPGNDRYVGTPTYNSLSGEGFHNEIWFFEGSHGYATAGGIDEAKFFDSTGDDDRAYLDDTPGSIDLLSGAADRVRMTNETLDILYEAAGFDYVMAKATDKGDTKALPQMDLLQFDLELEGPWQD